MLYRVGSATVGVLPRRLALAIATAAGGVASRLLPARDAIVRANLSRVVGALPTAEMDALVRRSFIEYARYWALAAHLSGIALRDPARLVTVTGRERYLEAMARGGVIFAVPHVGLWDAGGIVSRIEGFPIATVAEEAADPRLTAFFTRQRRRLGLDSFPPGAETTTALIALLRDHGAVALVADRDVVGDGIEVPFFGAPTRVPSGPVVLALRSGATILPSAVLIRPGGRVEVVIGEPLPMERQGRLRDDVLRLTGDLVARYEAIIREVPEQWHVFQPIWPADDAGPSRSLAPESAELPGSLGALGTGP
jgi:KDO2-lipid IV(A) lauroyltransferase